MITWLRRFVVVLSLIFWIGGTSFYVGIVVPLGRVAFAGAFSEVTAPATTWLNIAGAIALPPLLWDCLACRDQCAWRFRGRILTWLAAAASVLILFWLHVRLDDLMAEGDTGRDSPVFSPIHRVYLWTGAAQWLAVVVHIGVMLASWRAEDRSPAAPPDRATPSPRTV